MILDALQMILAYMQKDLALRGYRFSVTLFEEPPDLSSRTPTFVVEFLPKSICLKPSML